MASHWTYDGFTKECDLAQGDILERTGGLIDLFKQVHAHFCDEKYLNFLVLSQSCDLVVRDGARCKAHHITLAVIRSLSAVLPNYLRDACGTQIDSLYNLDQKTKAVDLVTRILNQNEQSLGLFYLYPDADAGVAEHSVAQLRITISFRAEHYETLRKARVGRLKPEFSSKLGWLSGNLYSRVATTDWAEQSGGKEKLKDIIKEVLPPKTQWIGGKLVTNAAKAGFDFASVTPERLPGALSKYAPPDRKAMVLASVETVASKLLEGDAEGKVPKLVERLRSDPAFQDALK